MPTATRCPTARSASSISRTPYAFDGYWKNPEKTAEAFRGAWCSVGDMARRDADGYYHLVDRKSNMIISGGENIYPSEVEALLGAHPAVQDVAVIGVPHDKWGEAVHAVVVLHAGACGDRKTRSSTGAGPHRRLQAPARDLRSSPNARCRARRPARSSTGCCATASRGQGNHETIRNGPALRNRGNRRGWPEQVA